MLVLPGARASQPWLKTPEGKMRSGTFLIVGLCLLLVTAPVRSQDTPDPSNCYCTLDETQRLLLIPGGPSPPPDGPWAPLHYSAFSVEVRNAQGEPISDAVVEILVAGQDDWTTCICANQDLVKTTDPNGYVSFNIAGGGCRKHRPDGCVIRANDIIIRTYDAVMSPDYWAYDDYGRPGYCSWTVNPHDLAGFVGAYHGGGGPASCHDYNNDGTTDPTDLGIFIQSYFSGTGYCYN
jgi:hypothetical protein